MRTTGGTEVDLADVLTLANYVLNHPGHADQKSHGRRRMSATQFDERVAKATTGDAALSSAALRGNLSGAESAAVSRYGGDGSYVINADLRASGGEADNLVAKNRASVEQLDSVMARSALGQDTVVYRKIGHVQRVFGDYGSSADLTGLKWRDHAYASTSVNPRPASHYELRILAPKGTKGFSHPELDSDEIVLGRGLTYTVVRDNGIVNAARRLDVVVS